MDTYIGFDSAWTDNQKAPGAICAVIIDRGKLVHFYPPGLASFEEALRFIDEVRSPVGVTLIALDQPTVVPNLDSMRPVEHAAASLISWLGGGVQPSNRGRVGMFSNDSPIWNFLARLGAIEVPENAREAQDGLYLMEVFPAIALASLCEGFFGRFAAPKYNPGRKKTFKAEDWVRVAEAAAGEFHALGCEDLVEWCHNAARIGNPVKADQDRLDSALCLWIALHWRLRPRNQSLLLGDLATGYMVMPASLNVREYLREPAQEHSVAMDGA